MTSLTTSRSGLLGEGAKSLPRTFRSIGHQSKAHQASKGLVSACQSSCRNSQWRSFYTYSSHPELHPKIDVFYCTMSTSARQPPEELQARAHRLCFVHYTRDMPFRRCDRQAKKAEGLKYATRSFEPTTLASEDSAHICCPMSSDTLEDIPVRARAPCFVSVMHSRAVKCCGIYRPPEWTHSMNDPD